MSAALQQSPMARFMEKVSPEPNTGCWLWTSTIGTDGYGAFWFRGRTRMAMRVILELNGTSIPTRHHVCHRCDNPACVNPEHLFVGTPAENASDMDRKGRRAIGERAARARLSLDQVKEIIARCGAEETQESVGRTFGIRQTHVSHIVTGRCWNAATGRASKNRSMAS